MLWGAVNITWYVTIGAMAVVLFATLVAAFVPPRFMQEFTTDALNLRTSFITLGFDQMTVQNPRAIALGFLGFALAMICFAAAIVRQLRGICANLRAGVPFAPDNAGRIRAMGLLVIISTIVKSVLFTVIGMLLADCVIVKGVELKARLGSLDLTGILLGLLILVLAEVFRYGAELQEERNLTV